MIFFHYLKIQTTMVTQSDLSSPSIPKMDAMVTISVLNRIQIGSFLTQNQSLSTPVNR